MFLYSFLILLVLMLDFLSSNNSIKKFSKSTEKVAYVVLCIILVIIVGIRYDVGADYISIYKNLLEVSKYSVVTQYDSLFLLLNQFVNFINGNVVVLMLICSIYTIPAFFYFIKENIDEKYHFFSVFIFIGSTMFFALMNAVRQYMAIATLLYGFTFLKEKKYVKYIIINIIAMLFHSSAVINFVFLGFYYLTKKSMIKYGKKSLFFKFILISYFISLFFIFSSPLKYLDLFIKFIPSKYYIYISSEYMSSVFLYSRNGMAIFKLILPNIFFIYMLLKMDILVKNNNNKFYLFFCAWFFYLFISNSFYGINIFIRLSFYFEVYLLLIVPTVLENMKSEGNYAIKAGMGKRLSMASIFKFIIIVYYISLVVYSIYMKNGHGVIPYQTFFSIFF